MLRGQFLKNGFKLIGKTHVKHLIGFVKHEGLDPREVKRAFADVIQRSARRRNNRMYTAV